VLIDELSFGLAPLAVKGAFELLAELNRDLGSTALIVEQNVTRALEVVVANLRGRWPLRITKEERELAMSMLEKTGAAPLADAQMRDLSGGETQRVFLARALATRPELLILDEPTAGVDVGGRAAIVELMAEISASNSIAAILVTHNLQAVARCAERVVYLERTVKAWGLWSELSRDQALSAIQIASGDHRAMAMDGD
jgi:ABC-type Mn2+/Zn2+ transport system ATPase subunit